MSAMLEAPKELLRNALAPLVSRIDQPLVVTSFGRSGSTVLFNALIQSAARGTGKQRLAAQAIIRGTAWDLHRRLARGRCYKTHDYPTDRLLPPSAKVLYVFGDPIDATLSVLHFAEIGKLEWLDEHATHLRAHSFDHTKLVIEDTLEIERHLRVWLEYKQCDVAMIRYETMWENVDWISEFVGYRVILPEKRDRNPKSAGTKKRRCLEETFVSMKELTRSLPDIRIRHRG